MMIHTTQAVSSFDIFLTCSEEKYYSNELVVQKNTLIRMLSGEMHITLPGRTLVIDAGDTIFFPRFELAKVKKLPKDGRPYKSVAIYFSPDAVQHYLTRHHIKPELQKERPGIQLMAKHPLLDSLFNSLLPYFELENQLPKDITEGKVNEAFSILKLIDDRLFQTLANQEEPGKINLTEFMERNFMFNMPLEQFSYLSGRSLTTFKRDFKKAFTDSPQRWLTQKRLEFAYTQLTENGRHASDVYLDAGFENLSHFSYAFKKKYGC